MRCEERNFRVYINEVNITHLDTDLYEKFECKVYQVDNRTYMDSIHIFKRTVDDITVHAALDFWKLNSKQKMKLYDVEFDGCYILENANKNRLFNMYVQNLKKHATSRKLMRFTPPLNVSYEVKNLTMSEQDFHSFVPLGKFRSLIEYYTNQKSEGASHRKR
ncbi:GD23908 [Drosophila simulans]|uniref:GD23908 n=1 Tax=Drosophila simulans TaxID=7240 RepID=B4Q535_DROSI|nr:GD23908 [Drosophila simulans]